jgi:HlyD family secretion protein
VKFPVSIILALIGLVVAIGYVINSARVEPRPDPVRPPAVKPYQDALAGTGLVEAAEDNISVLPYRTGKLKAVFVKEGQHVQAGQPLYALDTDDAMAQLAILQANKQRQQAVLNQLHHQPRPEDTPPLLAAVKQAKINVADLKATLYRLEHIGDPRAISQDDLSHKRYGVQLAQAQLQKAQADLKRQQAGAWQYDIATAEADLKAIEAQAKQTQVALHQAQVVAPKAGTILKVNTRVGETVATSQSDPPVVLGNTDRLQIRVDIDEVNANRITANMPAEAVLRGDSKQRFNLVFKRIIPYMVPKKNLTGSNTERVDVRVLQLIYEFTPPSFPVYVGQQVDVFLKPAVASTTK